MRAASLAVQGLVLSGIAGLVFVAYTAQGGPPEPLAPASARTSGLAAESALGSRPAAHVVRILDRETGEPVADLPIRRLTPADRGRPALAGTTDAEGLVALDVDGDIREVYAAWLPGYVTRPIALGSVATSRARPEVFHLSRAGALTGNVTDLLDRPYRMGRYQVALVIPTGTAPRASTDLAASPRPAGPAGAVPADDPTVVLRVPVDEDGAYLLHNVPPEVAGLTVAVELEDRRWKGDAVALAPFRVGELRRLDLSLYTARAGEAPLDPWLVPKGDLTLKGTLLDRDGQPVPYEAIAVVPASFASTPLWLPDAPLPAHVRTVQTDADGSFVVAGLAPGLVYVGRKHRPAFGLLALSRCELDTRVPLTVNLHDLPTSVVEVRLDFGSDSSSTTVYIEGRTDHHTSGIVADGLSPFSLGPFLPEAYGGLVELTAEPLSSLHKEVVLTPNRISPAVGRVTVTAQIVYR